MTTGKGPDKERISVKIYLKMHEVKTTGTNAAVSSSNPASFTMPIRLGKVV